MSTSKKVAIGLAVTVAAFVGLVVATLFATFGSDGAIIEGEVAPGVHVVRDGPVATSYIVEVEGGVALIDAADDRSGAAINAFLKAQGNPTVLALFITHGHGDHIGACSLFPEARIIAHADEVPLIHGEVAPRGPVAQLMGKSDGACRVTEPVTDDQVVSVGGVDFHAYHLPGHTDGSTAWLARRTLFLGDAASITSEGKITGAKWIFSNDQTLANANLAKLAERLDANEIGVLAPAHTGTAQGLAVLAAYTAE
jgi:glyoxylase-like metal-dependent hydrolase (beta-lactamase superfamily II)